MELELDRSDITNPISTSGVLYAPNGERICVTLERPWNAGDNLAEISCILPGRYELKFEYSPHFNRPMIHLQNVPGRTQIMIHNANWAPQLKGCIAVGRMAVKDAVLHSVAALEDLEEKVHAALETGEVWLTVNNPK